jgi:hypothetical protein
VSEPGEIVRLPGPDGLPALAPEAVVRDDFARLREPAGRALIRSVSPAAQTVAVAAGGFVAGAAIVGLASRRRHRTIRTSGESRRRRPRRRRRALMEIVGTRSVLLDVHLLGSPADR